MEQNTEFTEYLLSMQICYIILQGNTHNKIFFLVKPLREDKSPTRIKTLRKKVYQKMLSFVILYFLDIYFFIIIVSFEVCKTDNKEIKMDNTWIAVLNK